MFIPRTLAETEGPGRGAWARALIVGTFIALALFATLSVSLGGGQVDLSVGDVAQTDIRASQTVNFISESQTEAAREAAADAVAPVYEQIAPRADIRARQLRFYDALARSITNLLTQRNAGTLSSAEVVTRLNEMAPTFTDEQVALVSPMTVSHWTSVSAAGRTVLEAALSGEVREDAISEARQELRARRHRVAGAAGARAGRRPGRGPAGRQYADLRRPDRGRAAGRSRAGRAGRGGGAAGPDGGARRRPDHRARPREARPAGADPTAHGGDDHRRPRTDRSPAVGVAGRLPVALRARGLVPQPVAAALRPCAGGECRGGAHRGRSNACGPTSFRRPPPCSSSRSCSTPVPQRRWR